MHQTWLFLNVLHGAALSLALALVSVQSGGGSATPLGTLAGSIGLLAASEACDGITLRTGVVNALAEVLNIGLEVGLYRQELDSSRYIGRDLWLTRTAKKSALLRLYACPHLAEHSRSSTASLLYS